MTKADAMERARKCLRRGAKLGEPIPRCSCFDPLRPSLGCVGACEEAVDYVAAALLDADERLRVAEAERDEALADGGEARMTSWHSQCDPRIMELQRALDDANAKLARLQEPDEAMVDVVLRAYWEALDRPFSWDELQTVTLDGASAIETHRTEIRAALRAAAAVIARS